MRRTTRPGANELVMLRPEGLWCEAGGFFIDPWRPVERALITHGHGDHARNGSAAYLAADASAGILRARLPGASVQTVPYGERLRIGDATVSYHPAGHVLGSAQIRIEADGEVWVVSGDYKVEADRTCDPFEPVACDIFVTESTFGLPIYRWRPQKEIFDEVNAWWAANAAAGRASVLFAYAFGKAQRLLAGVDPSIGPIVVHGAVEPLNRAYREAGVPLPHTQLVSEVKDKAIFRTALVVAPPSAAGSTWMRRFGDYSDAFASGWMRLRGARRRRAVDRGFVLSDHADWPGLQQAISASGAHRVIVTHGYEATMVRWLREQGLEADFFATAYGGEEGAALSEEGADGTGNDAAAKKADAAAAAAAAGTVLPEPAPPPAPDDASTPGKGAIDESALSADHGEDDATIGRTDLA